MKRCCLVVAVLLAGSVDFAHAYYLVIKVNLAVTDKKKDEEKPAAPPGRGGAPGMGGPAMGGGGRGGARNPGAGGMMGGRGGGAGPGTGGGLMGGGRGGAGRGPGGGAPYTGGGEVLQGSGRTNANTIVAEDLSSAPLEVHVVIEVERKPTASPLGGSVAGMIRHSLIQGGKTSLPHQDDEGEIRYDLFPIPTVKHRFGEFEKDIKDTDENKADKLLRLAQWAISHGLVEKVPEVMDKLAQADPKSPAVIAYQKVRAAMERPIKEDDPAISWKDKLGDLKSKQSKHYTLLYDANESQAQSSVAQADRYLDLLEKNYQSFFDWFALRGKVLPVPQRRLVAVLLTDEDAFNREHRDIFDETPLVADGFFARRENLAVFSAKRLDEGYKALEKATQPFWAKGWTPAELLQGKIRQVEANQSAIEIARAQTLTLVLKAMEMECAVAAVSHEGTRQLIAGIGMLPRSVDTPRWIDFGIASLFETPKGSLWMSTGGPNLTYLISFKTLDSKKKENPLPEAPAALKAVVTDELFHGRKEQLTKDEDVTKARTLAWALTYFLAQKKLDGLLRYYQELSGLPRDLELDGDELLGCFARAFSLTDSAKPNMLDENKLAILANEWYQFIRNTPLEAESVTKEVLDRAKKPAKK